MRHWTAEEKAKQSKFIQSWQPWTKATGAITPEGKAISSLNAFKGGFRDELRETAALLKEQREMMKRI